MSLTKATYSMIQGAAYNVLDFGADSTGVSSSAAAFNLAVANGGTVYVPPGTYKLDSKVTLSVNNTTLFLAANVTLNLSGVAAVQSPFGNQIHIIANDCAVIGSGPSSVLQITNGSQANAVGLLHHVRCVIRDLTIDGGKAGGSAIADDTFMSGVSIVVSGAAGVTEDAQVTVDNCLIKNFLQYGINIYGTKANSIKITNCTVRDIGKVGDANSVGAGIVSTSSVSDLTIANNTIKNNKQYGVFISSAGVNGSGFVVANNNVRENYNGIVFIEQSTYGSTSGQGLKQISVTGNNCYLNARSGIAFNVDTVGFLKNISITGNSCCDNVYAGIELNCTATTPNILSDLIVSGNECNGNGTIQQSAGVNVVNVQGVPRSFTPYVYGSTSAGTATYDSQLGSYTQVGNIVTFEIDISWSGHTGTGDLILAGLVIPAANQSFRSINFVATYNLVVTGQVAWGPEPTKTYGTLLAINNGTWTPVAMDASALLRVSGSYFID